MAAMLVLADAMALRCRSFGDRPARAGEHMLKQRKEMPKIRISDSLLALSCSGRANTSALRAFCGARSCAEEWQLARCSSQCYRSPALFTAFQQLVGHAALRWKNGCISGKRRSFSRHKQFLMLMGPFRYHYPSLRDESWLFCASAEFLRRYNGMLSNGSKVQDIESI